MNKVHNPHPQAAIRQSALGLIWFGIAFTAVSLLLGILLGRDQWVAAQLRAHGRTAPAQIFGLDREFGAGDVGDSVSVHYRFTLPSGQSIEDTLHTSPKEVTERLGVSPPIGFQFTPPAIQATVRYLPGRPGDHALQGFGGDTSGSPLAGGVVLLAFVAFGGVALGAGLKVWREAEVPQAVALGGGRGTENADGAVQIPGFHCRQEGQRFVLQPTWSGLLGPVFGSLLGIALFSLPAFFGASLVHSSWLTWRGEAAPDSGLALLGRVRIQAGHADLASGLAIGAGLFLFGAVPVAWCFGGLAEVLGHGLRPSILDQDCGHFLIGVRVICPLSAITQLTLRRRYNPDNPADAGYYAGFVLRDGRRVPLGKAFSAPSFRKESPERGTFLGKEPHGGRIEALMQRAATFSGVEYALTHEPDEALRGGE